MDSGHGNGDSGKQDLSLRKHRNDEEAPQPKTKRQRVSRACDSCRSSRDRCDGNMPCHTCLASGRNCDYTTAPKKRGIQPGYIRALELSLAALLSQDKANGGLLLNQMQGQGCLREPILSKDGARSHRAEELLNLWSNSTIAHQIEALLSGGPDVTAEATIPPPHPSHVPDKDSRPNDFETHRNDLDPSLRAGQGNGLNPNTVFPVGPSASITEQRLGGSHATAFSTPFSGNDDTLVELPADIWVMIEHYYAFHHNWLPMSDRNDMLKTVYAYPLPQKDVLAPDWRGRHAELWSMIAIVSRSNSRWSAFSKQSRSMADICVPRLVDRTSNPGLVAANIHLALISLGEGDSLNAWLSIGMAARLFLFWYWNTPTAFTIPHCLRLICSVFVVESIICANVKSPPHLSVQLMPQMREARLPEDSIEEWSPWLVPSDQNAAARNTLKARRPGRCLSIFNQLIKLAAEATSSGQMSGERLHPTIFEAPTPQKLHYEVILLWFRYVKSNMSFGVYTEGLLHLVDQFQGCGGAASVPPTVLPLLRSVATSSSEMLAQHPFAIELMQLWHMDQPAPKSKSLPVLHAPMNNLLPGGPASIPPPQSNFEEPPGQIIESVLPQMPIATKELGLITTNIGPTQQTSHDTPSAMSDSGMQADFQAIFDEFAQLEGNRGVDDGSQFMQNLGLGPDSDLRAFFGSDYQETDPLLAYLPFDQGLQPDGTMSWPGHLPNG